MIKIINKRSKKEQIVTNEKAETIKNNKYTKDAFIYIELKDKNGKNNRKPRSGKSATSKQSKSTD